MRAELCQAKNHLLSWNLVWVDLSQVGPYPEICHRVECGVKCVAAWLWKTLQNFKHLELLKLSKVLKNFKTTKTFELLKHSKLPKSPKHLLPKPLNLQILFKAFETSKTFRSSKTYKINLIFILKAEITWLMAVCSQSYSLCSKWKPLQLPDKKLSWIIISKQFWPLTMATRSSPKDGHQITRA